MSFWFGVAWLCLGGDAPAQEPQQSEPGQQQGQEASQTTGDTTEAVPTEPPPAEDGPRFLAEYAPPAIEGPGLRIPEPMTRAYLDISYARTDDLSGLPLIAGSAHNYRLAAGGTLRWHRFSFDGELAFSNVTTIDVTQVPGGVPFDQDKHQTATSLGDLRLGANWSTPLDAAGRLVGGFGLRTRLPTHTVVFQFHLSDMVTIGKYVFPYYFHIEPTLLLGGAFGPFAFVINQGALLMMGPDGDFQNLHIVEPNLLFWSAHYAVVYAPLPVVGLSVDLATDVQLNHVSALYFERVNGITSAALNVGLQVHLGAVRVDLVGRRGLTRDGELFGVLQYAGTESLTLRVGARFD